MFVGNHGFVFFVDIASRMPGHRLVPIDDFFTQEETLVLKLAQACATNLLVLDLGFDLSL